MFPLKAALYYCSIVKQWPDSYRACLPAIYSFDLAQQYNPYTIHFINWQCILRFTQMYINIGQIVLPVINIVFITFWIALALL